MRSAIYRGWLRHRRFHPVAHRFSYRVFMMYLDLDELEDVMSLSPWWSAGCWRPARFERSDFLGDPRMPLDAAVRQRIFEETGVSHEGPIRLLANLRYFGFGMNPIACYYCFDARENLKYLVAEVTNTPWNERVSYVLPCNPERRFQRISFDKAMHVSPFNPMGMTYRWCSNLPSDVLTLNLDTERDGEKHMDATLVLKRREIDASSLASILVEYPWMTARVLVSIYWQAMKLWLKRAPFYGHPNTREWRDGKPPTIKKLKT